MNDLFNRLEEISEKSGAASIYGTHFSKGNQSMKDPIDRVSGSGVFGRDPDTIVTVTPHKVKGAYTFEAITRNLPPIEPFVILWDMPFFTREDSLDPSCSENRKQEGRSSSNRKCCGACSPTARPSPAPISRVSRQKRSE